MKNLLLIVLCSALCGCASSSQRSSPPRRGAGAETPADTAKLRYWQLQQPPLAAEAPRYRRLTITIPAHTEGGVNYEAQTRTILISQ